MLQPVTWHHALLSAWSVSLAGVSGQKESVLTLNVRPTDEGIGSNFEQVWVTQITEKRYTVLN